MPDYDAIVIGAGFGGLRAIHELRDKQGLSVKVLEAGTDVGGTWYWNRYPGARTDTESWAYCFSFDDELMQEWDWPERFPRQHQVLDYLRHASERFDFYKDIQFESRVAKAVYDEPANEWTIETEAGETFTCTYFVPASGVLSVVYEPPFPGLETFEGDWYQTSRWPKDKVDFAGKRVVLIGTGATGVQVVPEVAHQAEHLTVLQRTPNFVMPSRNHPLDDVQRAELKAKNGELWAKVDTQPFAFPFDPANRLASETTDDAEFDRILDAGWESGGFRYLFETFDDLLVNQEANDRASEYVRNKIRAIVSDPETAELLCPKSHPFGGKRPPLGHFYYETFNRPNVELVSVRDNPITEITAQGPKLADGTQIEADIIIFALGFDAISGAMASMDVRGRGGRTIVDKWAEGPQCHLGVACDEFPNMFMVMGPQSAFANIPPIINKQVEMIGRAVGHMREHGIDTLEVTSEAVQAWDRMCNEVVDMLVIDGTGQSDHPWFLGTNIPGKPRSVLMFFGGAGPFFQALDGEADGGFASFSAGSAVPA